MAANFQLKVGLNLDGLAEIVTQYVFPAVEKAVADAAVKTQVTWQAMVLHAPGLWMGAKTKYADSIQWRMVGPTKAEVWTDEAIANLVEDGFPEYDQKKVLQTSSRTRVTKKGEKYLIIPFRHNTPGHEAHALAMPEHIYAQAKGLPASRVTGTTTRLSATGATVPQHIYQWGGRLPAGLAPKKKPIHATDIYAGMVRFETSSGKQKSSAYLTFRIMREGAVGKWLLPPKPGQHLVQKLVTAIHPVIESDIRSAIQNVVAGLHH